MAVEFLRQSRNSDSNTPCHYSETHRWQDRSARSVPTGLGDFHIISYLGTTLAVTSTALSHFDLITVRCSRKLQTLGWRLVPQRFDDSLFGVQYYERDSEVSISVVFSPLDLIFYTKSRYFFSLSL